SFFVKWHPSDFKMNLELHLGEVGQDDRLLEKFAGGHLDLMWDFSPRWGIQARYDQFDPNTKKYGDSEKAISLGFSLSNKTKTSTLFLIGTKVLEEGTQIHNDEARLVWRL